MALANYYDSLASVTGEPSPAILGAITVNFATANPDTKVLIPAAPLTREVLRLEFTTNRNCTLEFRIGTDSFVKLRNVRAYDANYPSKSLIIPPGTSLNAIKTTTGNTVLLQGGYVLREV